jgi:RNA polymerase sigma factor (sigma-70 family)
VEDLTSNVYEKLFINSAQCLQQWRGQARLSTYLVQITRNLCTDYARVRLKMRSSDESSKILKHMPVHAHTFEDDNDRQALLDVLHEGMGKIPSQQAVILKMRMEGATLREIADMLRLPVGTVSVYNSRAMATMRERLTLSRKS